MDRDAEYERRLKKLLAYVEGTVRDGGRRRIAILVNGDEFGVAADELLLNPRGPIPEDVRRYRDSGKQHDEKAHGFALASD